jgi:ABC-type branched-subunit amino acid transport system permease subunit
MRIVLRPKLGLRLAAIHDSDSSAASSGVDVFRLKLYAFGIAAFLHFLLARYGELSLLVQGAILVVIMLTVPEGIVGLVRRKTRNYQSLLQLSTKR